MRECLALASTAFLVVSCAGMQPPVDTARPPPNAFGINADPGMSALNLANWAFSAPERTAGRPVDAARAVAAVDYMAGSLSSSPRWDYVDPLTKVQMLQARVEVRQVIGVAPNTPSQIVVDDLLASAYALERGNQAAALGVLQSPAFPEPQETLQRLANLPYMQLVNVATQRAAASATGPGNFDCITCR